MPFAPPGAGPIRANHRIDLDALERYLVAEISGFGASLARVLQFKGGQSNPTFFIEDSNGARFVLRKKPPGKLLKSAHMVEREYRVMSALAATDVPVPRMFCLCTDEAVIGTPFYVMEYVEGRILKNPHLPSLSMSERTAVYRDVVRTLANIHRVDPHAIGLDDYGSTGNYYERQLSRWTRQYNASKTQEIAAMSKLIEWLTRNLPPKCPKPRLVHGDFRIDNCVLHPTEPRVIAVLDWELSTLGNPLSDVGYFAMPFEMEVFLHSPGLIENEPFESGIPHVFDLLALYEKDTEARVLTTRWPFYVSFSFFRLAAIVQGVYKRSLQGNASDESASSFGAMAEYLSETGWKVIERSLVHRSSLAALDNASMSRNARCLLMKLDRFVTQKVYDAECDWETQRAEGDRWKPIPIVEELKKSSRDVGLWNLFLPRVANLSTFEYAALAELMGRSPIASELFNCAAPDTGNMEILEEYGTAEHRRQWLDPLLDGSIRSCFAMTEPDVASSDATNISTSIEIDGDSVIIRGQKWWISGAGDSRCKVCLVLGRSNWDDATPRHKAHSVVIVPMDTPGLSVGRALHQMGFDDAPHGHCEMKFDNVRVPLTNVLAGLGRGFEIAQSRLGPGRIHHCMRLVGLAERSLSLLCERATSGRQTFGAPLIRHGTIQAAIASSRADIAQARLLVLEAARLIDTLGKAHSSTRKMVSLIKSVVPTSTLRVVDRSIQVHGAAGMQHPFLSYAWVMARSLRIADGPDEVHARTVCRLELREQGRESKL